MSETEQSTGNDLAHQVLAWWADAQYMTTGENGERNVFDTEPDFVEAARAIVARGEAGPALAQ